MIRRFSLAFVISLMFTFVGITGLYASQSEPLSIPHVSIRIYNPDSAVFGMPEIMEITLEDISNFHGYCGPAIALSFRAVQEGFKALYAEKMPVRKGVKVYTSFHGCHADPLAYITGARTNFGSGSSHGDLILIAPERNCYIFVDKKSGKKVTLQPQVDPVKTVKPLLQKAKQDPKYIPEFRAALNVAIHAYIFDPVDKVFKIIIE